MAEKLSAKLMAQMKKAHTSDLVEIILELYPQAESVATVASGAQSRSHQIAVKKEAFSRNVASVEEAIRKVGGEITGLAWLNHVVRARVPVQGVQELSKLEKVAVLDTPHTLKSDFD